MFGSDESADVVASARPALRLRQALELIQKQRRAGWARPTSEEVVHGIMITAPAIWCRKIRVVRWPTNWLADAREIGATPLSVLFGGVVMVASAVALWMFNRRILDAWRRFAKGGIRAHRRSNHCVENERRQRPRRG